jgi:hypothetical protein
MASGNGYLAGTAHLIYRVGERHCCLTSLSTVYATLAACE